MAETLDFIPAMLGDYRSQRLEGDGTWLTVTQDTRPQRDC